MSKKKAVIFVVLFGLMFSIPFWFITLNVVGYGQLVMGRNSVVLSLVLAILCGLLFSWWAFSQFRKAVKEEAEQSRKHFEAQEKKSEEEKAERQRQKEKKQKRVFDIEEATRTAMSLPFDSVGGKSGAYDVLKSVGFFGKDEKIPEDFWELSWSSSTLVAKTLVTIFRNTKDRPCREAIHGGLLRLNQKDSCRAFAIATAATAIEKSFAKLFY